MQLFNVLHRAGFVIWSVYSFAYGRPVFASVLLLIMIDTYCVQRLRDRRLGVTSLFFLLTTILAIVALGRIWLAELLTS